MIKPKVDIPSTFIEDSDFEIVWSWLPNYLKLQNPILAYSTARHGFSLQTLYTKCEVFTIEKKPMVFFLHLTNHVVLLIIKIRM